MNKNNLNAEEKELLTTPIRVLLSQETDNGERDLSFFHRALRIWDRLAQANWDTPRAPREDWLYERNGDETGSTTAPSKL